MNEITDLRVVKTLENIKHGFTKCISQKTFSSISVKDITTAARINRSTFYKYYEDKYQLRESLIKSTLEELSNNINLASFNLENNKMNESLEALRKQLQFMYDHKDWYLILWNKNMELYVYEDMARIFERRTGECLRENSNGTEITRKELSEKQELLTRLFASSAMTTVKWWYEYSPNMTPKDVANIIMDNIKFGMHRTFFQVT
ncbi:TetR/AcrR family transcriptional regulator C-terminal domain-containing protein [Paenibacillus brasilensis]|uniref:AcrR family transcriptional regulator n=1 Tax=Paenibacillus brasilensis TaxID=128574 RepID=A0ABU0L386_9BACL|nr:TetR/AcrR family transcriptional regulator C-terminal domain-containing protein [Paenibacillus brasilensis]MDQ0495342.1 AcrR family transcriptional regulator [Paenibacillus brasilensis]